MGVAASEGYEDAQAGHRHDHDCDRDCMLLGYLAATDTMMAVPDSECCFRGGGRGA